LRFVPIVSYMRLRRALTWTTVGLGALTLAACAALVVLTTLMRQNVEEINRSQGAANVASDLSRNALANAGAASPLERALTEARGRILLDRLGGMVRDDAERTAYRALAPLLDGWWRSPADLASRPRGELGLALLRIEELFALRAEAELDRAQKLDIFANVVGVAGAILLAAGVASFLWMLRWLVWRPISALAASVARFAGGDLSARAPEEGAEEIRRIAAVHNQMADALARTREDQLRYVATVVHDLRNPLAVVQLAIGYVTPGRPLPPEARVREIFDLLGRQLRRLNSIVGDVLNAVQIEAGQIVLRRQSCDLGDLARACVSLFQTMCPTYRLELETHDPTALYADAVRLEQVLNNLVGNALKYAPQGTRVRVDVYGEDDEVTVTVADEGPGISPELEGRIFRPFTRGASEHEEVAGAGLGLYVSKRIIEAHGGTLELVATAGPGATFRFTVPRVAAPEEAESSRRAEPVMEVEAGSLA
jgi:signal transduction histidine kinase